MAIIVDPELSIQIDSAESLATISVRCDLGFIDSEVRTMNLLGMRYALQCRLLSAEAPDAGALVMFDPQVLPRFRDGAKLYEHPVFEGVAAAEHLHPGCGTDRPSTRTRAALLRPLYSRQFRSCLAG